MLDLALPSGTQGLIAATLIVYVLGMYALSFWARGKIHDNEDFLLAGRRLPLSLAWATLLATWFGAGTVLTAADEVRLGGVRQAALDPFGAGVCLLLAGLFFAAPLWRMKLVTVSDFFGRKFGRRAELLSAIILVPSYFGWIAAQLVATAGILELFFGIDPAWGILLAAAVGMGYTLLGGMWSVTLTDAVQIVLVLVGLVILGSSILSELGGGNPTTGLARLGRETPSEMLAPVATEDTRQFFEWLTIFCVGALGNLPGQDLMQRIFAARSAAVARWACLLAGVAYLTFGLIPILLGLSARLLFPDELDTAIVPALAHAFLSPALAVVFIVAVVSAILSTIDSAILAPAGVLAQNVFVRGNRGRLSLLTLNRVSVLIVTAGSLGMAFLGEGAYELLESAYSLTLVGLFVPLVLGLFRTPRGEAPALAAMAVGSGLWGIAFVAETWSDHEGPAWIARLAERFAALPVAFLATLASFAAYVAADAVCARRGTKL